MKGYVQLYTGNGKGKTTAALGVALRAAGDGLRVFIAQFIKSKAYSEDRALAKLTDGITIKKYGCGCFIRGKPKPADIAAAMRGLAACERAINSGRYDLVILDEAAIAAHLKLFPLAQLLEIITNRPPHVEIVLTGRYAPPALVKNADLVTEMVERKHYFHRGVRARKGIER